METLPVTARSHIDGKNIERAYTNHLSGYREWIKLKHAGRWLVFPRNIGPHLSMNEECLSVGEVYTILTYKDAHGRKGCLVAIVRGTEAKEVSGALKKIPEALRKGVKEVTLDFSESMHHCKGMFS